MRTPVPYLPKFRKPDTSGATRRDSYSGRELSNLRIKAEPTDDGGDIPALIERYARSSGTTQIFITRDAPALAHMLRLVRDMQVTVVAARREHDRQR
jgi:hypothetical protein